MLRPRSPRKCHYPLFAYPLFKRALEKARKGPKKKPPQNSPRTLFGKSPLGFLQKPSLDELFMMRCRRIATQEADPTESWAARCFTHLLPLHEGYGEEANFFVWNAPPVAQFAVRVRGTHLRGCTILFEIITCMKVIFSNYLGDSSYSFQGSFRIN